MAKRNAGEGVRVEGLKEFRAALKDIDKSLLRELGKINKTFSEEIVTAAKSAAEALGGVARHTAVGIKASAGSSGVFVGLDAVAAPAIFGAEFGGGKYGKGNPTTAGGYTTQFGLHRGLVGGALYTTIREKSPEMAERYGAAIDALAAKAFPDK